MVYIFFLSAFVGITYMSEIRINAQYETRKVQIDRFGKNRICQ